MTKRIDHGQLLDHARIVPSPHGRSCEDHSFEMPTSVFAAMAALFFGFLAVMTVGFASPGLAVPMAVSFVFLTAFFAVPVLFVRAPGNKTAALQWSRFMKNGIQTATGHSSGGEAAVLTLLLPFLVFLWAVVIVAIAAIV